MQGVSVVWQHFGNNVWIRYKEDGKNMLVIKVKLPTKKLLIKRVLAKLFQSFVYTYLDDKEHEGYKHQNGKVFKAMNFKITYIKDEILIKYVALDKDNEKIIAKEILQNGLKLGEIHISSVEISLQNRHQSSQEKIKVGGFVVAAIKDGNSSKKIYLEPKSHKFQEILYNNTLQKYEALFAKSYDGALKITIINQKPRERLFFYNKGAIKAWYGIYEIEAENDMLDMILDTGLGANAMQGVGFVEMIEA